MLGIFNLSSGHVCMIQRAIWYSVSEWILWLCNIHCWCDIQKVNIYCGCVIHNGYVIFSKWMNSVTVIHSGCVYAVDKWILLLCNILWLCDIQWLYNIHCYVIYLYDIFHVGAIYLPDIFNGCVKHIEKLSMWPC